LGVLTVRALLTVDNYITGSGCFQVFPT
jgi:hypothetical protein